jgi:hypothetical protein
VNVELLVPSDVEGKPPVVGHTFIIYEEGHVMLSSKVKTGSKDAYDKFIAMMLDLYPLIVDEFSTQKQKEILSKPPVEDPRAAAITTTVSKPGTIFKRKQPKVIVEPASSIVE